MTDEALVTAYRDGDPLAFERLVERHLPGVFRYLARFAHEEASDLAQETFVKAWKKLDQFDAAQRFTPWLYAIARRTAIDFARKRRAVRFSELESAEAPFADTLADGEPLAEEALAAKEEAGAVRLALQKLSTRDRTILSLHLEEALTFAAIGERLGEPLNSVKSRYRRALGVLRRLLA